MIGAGTLTPPLSVTHVDAHADLGLGDATYIQLITEHLFLPVGDRLGPVAGLVNDGNWLACAMPVAGCDLTCVRNLPNAKGRPGDLFPYYMENGDLDASNIEMRAMKREQLDELMYDREYTVASVEPKVPLRHMSWEEFDAEEPFDVICLARSPDYTPVELDPLFDEARQRFIDEDASP